MGYEIKFDKDLPGSKSYAWKKICAKAGDQILGGAINRICLFQENGCEKKKLSERL